MRWGEEGECGRRGKGIREGSEERRMGGGNGEGGKEEVGVSFGLFEMGKREWGRWGRGRRDESGMEGWGERRMGKWGRGRRRSRGKGGESGGFDVKVRKGREGQVNVSREGGG